MMTDRKLAKRHLPRQVKARSTHQAKGGLSDGGEVSKLQVLMDKLDTQLLSEKYQKGIATCNKILSIDPTNVRAYFNLGLCNQRLKRYKEAIAYYDNTLQIDPSHLIAIMNRTISLEESGELTETVEAYEEILKLAMVNSNKPVAMVALCNLYRYVECILICNEILAENPYDPDGLFYKAYALLKIYKIPDALDTAIELLKIQPSNIYALNLIGEAHIFMNNYEIALKAYRTILKINPGDQHALKGVVSIERKLQSFN